MTCHQQSAPQSTTAAYIHPDSHCAPCGDKDAAISECEEGAGSGFHSLKPEWAISMLYGLLHTAVRRGEFESFRGTASPLGTAVKVKVLPQTHTHSFSPLHLCSGFRCRQNDPCLFSRRRKVGKEEDERTLYKSSD